MDKKLSDWCFLIVSPQPFKICFKCPGWGHHSSLNMLEVWNQQPKRDKQLVVPLIFPYFSCAYVPIHVPILPKKNPGRYLPWHNGTLGFGSREKTGSRKTGCLCCIHQRFLHVCMYVSIYIYTIWLTVCYGNRVHLWRRYLYVPIKHDDFT